MELFQSAQTPFEHIALVEINAWRNNIPLILTIPVQFRFFCREYHHSCTGKQLEVNLFDQARSLSDQVIVFAISIRCENVRYLINVTRVDSNNQRQITFVTDDIE